MLSIGALRKNKFSEFYGGKKHYIEFRVERYIVLNFGRIKVILHF